MTCMASNLQARSQLPRPMQAKVHSLLLLPPNSMAAWQSLGPTYSKRGTATSEQPEQGTKATIFSPAPAETPMISATLAAHSAPPATHLFVGALPSATALA